jgi:enolase 1/2/3
MPTLTSLKARQVLDSRGRPTVEVDAIGSTGARGRAIVPSGASTGRHEALELRDKDSAHYGGLGVLKAVENVTKLIGPAIDGMDLDDQAAIDAKLIELDGSSNKSRLGANAILGVSLAVAHAAAAARGEELFVHLHRVWQGRDALANRGPAAAVAPSMPMPMVNMISGGLHAGGNLDIQDVLTIPVAAKTYSEALEMTVALYRAVGAVLSNKGFEAALVGDEGGYGPRLRDNEQAMDIVVEGIRLAGYEPGRDVAIALDVASSHIFDEEPGSYRLSTGTARMLDSSGMVELLAGWVDRFPIVSIEDGLAEDDWEGWRILTGRLGQSVQLIGDDLFATQIARLRAGIDRGAGNAILIKLNQVGTISETFDAIEMAQLHGFGTVVSARSGETEDSTIADLAVATGAGQIKIGSVARSERLAKYNRLLRIEEELGGRVRFLVGPDCF